MLYLKITSALQTHLCISTNIELYHELKKNFVSVVQSFFLLSVNIFVTTWQIVVFYVLVAKTSAHFCLRHTFHFFFYLSMFCCSKKTVQKTIFVLASYLSDVFTWILGAVTKPSQLHRKAGYTLLFNTHIVVK